jgi:hypothetical protein
MGLRGCFCHIPDLGATLRGCDKRSQAVEKAGRTRDRSARHGIDCRTLTGQAPQLQVRGGERGLYRTAMRLLHLHGC